MTPEEEQKLEADVDAVARAVSYGNYVFARQKSEGLLEKYPDHVELLQQYATCLMCLKDPEASLRVLDRLCELQPEGVWNHRYRSYVLGALKRYDEAFESAERAVQLAPSDADAWRRLGLAAEARGQLDLAIKKLRKAVKLDPTHADSWSSLTLLYNRVGLPRQARRAARQALSLRPDDEIYRRRLATTLKGEDAIRLLRSTLHRNATSFWSISYLAQRLMEMRRVSEALDVVTTIFTARDGAKESWFYPAHTLHRIGRSRPIEVQRLLRTHAESANKPELWLARWHLESQLGISEAPRWMAHARETNGDHNARLIDLCYWLQYAQLSEAQYDLARELLEKDLSDTMQGEAWSLWLNALRYSGRGADAVQWTQTHPQRERLFRLADEAVYWLLEHTDPASAMHAAEHVYRRTGQEVWALRRDTARARLGEPDALLHRVTTTAPLRLNIDVHWALHELQLLDHSRALATRLFREAPLALETLVMAGDEWLLAGNADNALRVGRLIETYHPADHRGPELLSAIAMYQLNPSDALEWSEITRTMTELCPYSLRTHALIQFWLGDDEEARRSALRTLSFHGFDATESPRQTPSMRLLAALLRGDVAAVKSIDRTAVLGLSEPLQQALITAAERQSAKVGESH